jgi:hypothetical protein
MEIQSPNQVYEELEKMNEAKEADRVEQLTRMENKLNNILEDLEFLKANLR